MRLIIIQDRLYEVRRYGTRRTWNAYDPLDQRYVPGTTAGSQRASIALLYAAVESGAWPEVRGHEPCHLNTT